MIYYPRDFVQGTELGHGHLSPKGLQGARRALRPWHTEGERTRSSSGSPGLWGHLSPGKVSGESEEHEQPSQDGNHDARGQAHVRIPLCPNSVSLAVGILALWGRGGRLADEWPQKLGVVGGVDPGKRGVLGWGGAEGGQRGLP